MLPPEDLQYILQPFEEKLRKDAWSFGFQPSIDDLIVLHRDRAKFTPEERKKRISDELIQLFAKLYRHNESSGEMSENSIRIETRISFILDHESVEGRARAYAEWYRKLLCDSEGWKPEKCDKYWPWKEIEYQEKKTREENIAEKGTQNAEQTHRGKLEELEETLAKEHESFVSAIIAATENARKMAAEENTLNVVVEAATDELEKAKKLFHQMKLLEDSAFIFGPIQAIIEEIDIMRPVGCIAAKYRTLMLASASDLCAFVKTALHSVKRVSKHQITTKINSVLANVFLCGGHRIVERIFRMIWICIGKTSDRKSLIKYSMKFRLNSCNYKELPRADCDEYFPKTKAIAIATNGTQHRTVKTMGDELENAINEAVEKWRKDNIQARQRQIETAAEEVDTESAGDADI